MKCTRHKPEACFNCTLPECIDTSYSTTPEETQCLRNVGMGYAPRRNTSNIEKYNALRRKRAKSREWNRIHQKEQTEKRREYFRQYHAKRKAEAVI